MRWVWIVALVVALAGHGARGEDIKPEQLKKNFDEAVAQLQSAQDRINKLAMDNEKLQAKINELQKQAEVAKANEVLYEAKTYQWRATFAAWELFLKRYPNLMGRWEAFLTNDAMNTYSLPEWTEPVLSSDSK